MEKKEEEDEDAWGWAWFDALRTVVYEIWKDQGTLLLFRM
jgi:hypothetical protein